MVKKRLATLPLLTALLTTALSGGLDAQDAATTIGNASKAMGAENSHVDHVFGFRRRTPTSDRAKQHRHAVGADRHHRITTYTRTIDFDQPASRAFGPTMPPTVPGAPPPMPGNFNQNITPAQNAWTQQLEIWITPWGFLKGAAANNATARRAKREERRVVVAGH